MSEELQQDSMDPIRETPELKWDMSLERLNFTSNRTRNVESNHAGKPVLPRKGFKPEGWTLVKLTPRARDFIADPAPTELSEFLQATANDIDQLEQEWNLLEPKIDEIYESAVRDNPPPVAPGNMGTIQVIAPGWKEDDSSYADVPTRLMTAEQSEKYIKQWGDWSEMVNNLVKDRVESLVLPLRVKDKNLWVAFKSIPEKFSSRPPLSSICFNFNFINWANSFKGRDLMPRIKIIEN